MAIREVLVSFTFEQQRLMLNLIGADVGDASLLLTPTNVVVTAINEVITGDVDLSNQTIGMDDGTLASPSLFWDAGQGFYKVDANKLGLSTSLAVAGNLEVDGDITFRAGNGTGGTLTFGDLDTDNIVINADVQSSIVPDSTANYNLGTAAKQWNNLWIDGTASIDTLEVDLNTTLTGDLSVNSGIIKVDPSTVGTASIFNDYVATAQVLMDASSITIGSNAPGTFMIRNSNITTPKTTINVFNTIAETVNAFGAASNVVTGLSTFGTTGVNSNYNIRSDDTVLDGDLNVNGGEILSQENTFDLLIANNDVRIGAANGVGETVINNSLKVTENVNLANSGTNVTIKDNTANALAIKEGANTYVQIQTTDSSERIIVYKDLYVVGNLDISGTSTVIDTTTLTVEDKNIELGTSGSPTDALADGGGITLKGTTDKTITYNNTNTAWQTNIDFRVEGSIIASANVEAQNNISIADNKKFLAGNANDLEIYHDGSNSFITNNTGEFQIANSVSGNTIFLQAKQNENSIKAIADGAVELYHDNSKKLETSATGVTVTGAIAAGNIFQENGSSLWQKNGSSLFLISSGESTPTVYVSDSGDDSTGDGTTSSPFRTIGKAWNYIPRVYVGNHSPRILIKGTSYTVDTTHYCRGGGAGGNWEYGPAIDIKSESGSQIDVYLRSTILFESVDGLRFQNINFICDASGGHLSFTNCKRGKIYSSCDMNVTATGGWSYRVKYDDSSFRDEMDITVADTASSGLGAVVTLYCSKLDGTRSITKTGAQFGNAAVAVVNGSILTGQWNINNFNTGIRLGLNHYNAETGGSAMLNGVTISNCSYGLDLYNNSFVRKYSVTYTSNSTNERSQTGSFTN